MPIIKFIAGVEVSYLDTKHQILLNVVIDYNCYEVNAKQGTQIKKHYLDGDLSGDKINEILKGEENKKPKEKIKALLYELIFEMYSGQCFVTKTVTQ